MARTTSMILLVALSVLGVAGQQPFTIPLPSGMSETEFFNGGAGDMYYTVGVGGALYGVNLTSESLQFTSPFPHAAGEATISGLFPLDVPGGMVLVQVDQTIVAVNGNGSVAWVSQNFNMPTRAHAYTAVGGFLFIVSQAVGKFLVVDLGNGTITGMLNILSGKVSSNSTVLRLVTPEGVTQLVSLALPSLRQRWALNGASGLVAENEKYLLVENRTATGDSQVLVLDPVTLSQINVLDAMNGISMDDVFTNAFTPILLGTTLLCGVGVVPYRFAAFNILTGVEFYQTFVGVIPSLRSPFYVVGDTLVSVHDLRLTMIDTASGQVNIVNNVPYTETHTITQVGPSIFSVANLQGYTLWDTAGIMISRNDQAPPQLNVEGYVWKNMYDVTTVGSTVIGIPI